MKIDISLSKHENKYGTTHCENAQRKLFKTAMLNEQYE